MRRFFRWLPILIIPLLLCGCDSSKSSASCESTFSEGKTFENACQFTVTDETAHADLVFTAHLSAGTLRWSLTDPQGTIIEFGVVTPDAPVSYGKVFDAPDTGTWKLTLDLSAGVGNYSAEWKAY
ncbi:hypothetical protein LARV_03862 [Longilinea arvoryzae]|uniref:Lipoprotein n=1 Tax=Longilinea arvoryzae TaxID=360412 RepID=A0A0K8MYF0_9CHLR|nr:hypothetical protein [Longilinea arvoryzae]GAP16066.1 hypothetical protein LARV_03862 [Longilinea arvoryzae]